MSEPSSSEIPDRSIPWYWKLWLAAFALILILLLTGVLPLE